MEYKWGMAFGFPFLTSSSFSETASTDACLMDSEGNGQGVLFIHVARLYICEAVQG